MTDVIFDNSNTNVDTPWYIRIYTSKIEDMLNNDQLIQNVLPISPNDWIKGDGTISYPENNIMDFKRIKNTFQINGQIDVNSNLTDNSSPDISEIESPVSDVNIVKDRLKEIAMTGGVVQMSILTDNTLEVTNLFSGAITSLTVREMAHEQDGTWGSPDILEVQISFVKGVNMNV